MRTSTFVAIAGRSRRALRGPAAENHLPPLAVLRAAGMRQGPTLPAERPARDRAAVFAQGQQFLPPCQMPQNALARAVPAGQGLAVGRKAEMPDHGARANETVALAARGEVPEADRVVLTPRGQQSPVGIEGKAEDV